MADEEFVAEKIVDKRVNDCGKVEYLVKWRNLSDVDNTWESMAALSEDSQSQEAILQFENQSRPESVHSAADLSDTSSGREVPSKEQSRPEKPRPKPKRQSSESHKKSTNKPNKKQKSSPEDNKQSAEETKPTDPKDLRGFDRKLEPEKICGVTDNPVTRELMFLIKWKGVNSADLVPAKQANQMCPQVVIQFYESNLNFK